MTKRKNLRERILLTREALLDLEKDILDRRHVERYALVRQWLSGDVVDCACGVGYGTYLCSLNPDVKTITGVDISREAIEHAKNHFSGDKIKYILSDVESLSVECDTLVCIETLEHLKTPEIIADYAHRAGAKELIVSYPSKKTTHYNPYHFWDFKQADVEKIFSRFVTIESIDLWHEITVLRMVRR